MSSSILYSAGKNDECLTLDYAVKPILKYIPENAVVWCPFDTELSEFVKQISKKNKVIASHICNGVVENKITFSSSYFCYNFLPKQIIMETL